VLFKILLFEEYELFSNADFEELLFGKT